MKKDSEEIFIADIESNMLLNSDAIDYTSLPYKLKPEFKIHCVVLLDDETDQVYAFYDGDEYVFDGREYNESDGKFNYVLNDYEPVEYIRKELKDLKPFIESRRKKLRVVFHNGINFDMLALYLYLGMDYEIAHDTGDKDSWCGKECIIDDTMVMSKTLNPDRYGGHSLDNIAKHAKEVEKIEFRKKVPITHRFKFFAADMLYYNIYDCKATKSVRNYLLREWGNWPWEDAYTLEKKVADIVTLQEHRGFLLFEKRAEKAVRELDGYIKEAAELIEPLLPLKKLPKTKAKNYTINASQFLKGTGEKSKALLKFVEKHEGKWVGDKKVEMFGKVWTLPLPKGEPLVTHAPAEIKDTTHIKQWLVRDVKWVPLEFKDRDLTIKTTKKGKVKRTEEEFVAAVEKYVEETLASPFCKYRCEHLGANRATLRYKLLAKREKLGRPVKVLTNPSFTYGQAKDPCPNLLKITDKFPYVQDMINYLTYNHRRNSILGGGFDPDDLDDPEFEPEKGYIPSQREDKRIPTPAGTCDAGTGRMRHRVVVNVPRTSSLYGGVMRALFGVEKDQILMGYDFSSLEARMEAHYAYKYDDAAKSFCKMLLAEKPNSVHCVTAKQLTELLKKEVIRDHAKNIKYGIGYGASSPKIAKMLGIDVDVAQSVIDEFWEISKPSKTLIDKLTEYWKRQGNKKFILGLDKRKIPTRSAHALFNSLLQSAGVICAKRAMVIHDKKLKEAGMRINFFKQTNKDVHYCQQLIAMHDEAQSEVDKKNTKWKMVKLDGKQRDEESEKEYIQSVKDKLKVMKEEVEKETGEIWSEIGHNDKAYYIGYHKAGQLAIEAVNETSEYYNLNIPLAAEYMLGKTWADCH